MARANTEIAMADPIPWLDEVKRTSKLTIALDESIGQQGWAKAFRDGIAKFNELRLGVTYEQTNDQANANVVAQAKIADFEFGYSDGRWTLETKLHKFDGNSVHGLCSMLTGQVRNRTSRSFETRVVKAFIFVPAKPRTNGGSSRMVGEPVRLVVAVHEMVHACGLDDDHHTVDDIFCWPRPRYHPQNPDEDRVEAYTGQRKDVVIAGRTISQPVMVSMPPVILNTPTQEKIRRLWTV
jgi:hypothetical protein